MSNIHRLRDRGLSYDDIEALISVADALRTARQIIYNQAKARPDLTLMPTYGDANGLYEGFCRMHDMEIAPVFDEAEHIKERIAARDPLYIEVYPKENDAYLASLPNGGMRAPT